MDNLLETCNLHIKFMLLGMVKEEDLRVSQLGDLLR